MKVLLDTNVILDVFLDRRPFVQPAAEIFNLVEQSRLEGLLCATTVTTMDYLLKEELPAAAAREVLFKLLSIFEIAVVNRPVIEGALRSGISDFEDAVIEQSGRLAGADAIITRNVKDFRRSALKVFDPIQFLAVLQQR